MYSQPTISPFRILDKNWQSRAPSPDESTTMTATLENAAKNLLSDPPWMRVFKNTYDSIEDQLNKVDPRKALPVESLSLFYTRIFILPISFCWPSPPSGWEWDSPQRSPLASSSASSPTSRRTTPTRNGSKISRVRTPARSQHTQHKTQTVTTRWMKNAFYRNIRRNILSFFISVASAKV